MQNLKISAISINTTPLDFTGNVAILNACIQSKEAKDSDILLFPELSLSGYGCEDAFYRPELWEKAFEKLQSLRQHSIGKIILVGLPIFKEGFLYNCIAVLFDGKFRALVPKMHLAHTGVHYETRWFHSKKEFINEVFLYEGNSIPFGNFIFNFQGSRFAIEICEDSWSNFKPSLWYAENGVDILFSPGASHFAFGKQKVRKTMFSESSRNQNNLVVYTNLNGNESGRIIFEGGSLFVESGKVVKEGDRLFFADFHITSYEYSPERIRASRAKEFRSTSNSISANKIPEIYLESRTTLPFRDERTFSYHLNTFSTNYTEYEEFTKAVSLGLFDYLRKSKTGGYTLSLSGGADSAICALLVKSMVVLAKQERGAGAFISKNIDEKKLLITLYQKTENNSTITETIAAKLAEELGVIHYSISIDSAVQESIQLIEEALGTKLNWKTDDLALQNIQARVRSPLVWLLANINGHLLLSTGNRSEASVGYTTMDGDSSGSVCPLSGVSKEFLLRFLDDIQIGNNRFITPKESIRMLRDTKPTAELRPLAEHQEDEKDLMPYPILQVIEDSLINKGLSEELTLQILKEMFPKESQENLREKISKFKRMFAQSQWKRERLPPGFHLDMYGIDPKSSYRFPILSNES